ncbi:MAG TPA: hypothetical protein VD995_11005 [Azospirillum sp.]|nr:hypothetical protein [Azospirillum sp.]
MRTRVTGPTEPPRKDDRAAKPPKPEKVRHDPLDLRARLADQRRRVLSKHYANRHGVH